MKFIRFFSLLLVSSVLHFIDAFGQLMVDTSYTPTELVQNILIGQGVLASNITYEGADSQRGFFNSQNSNVGIESGVILSNGDVHIAIGPNEAGGAGHNALGNSDADLTQLSNVNTFDLVKLEFDFIPYGNVVEFKYAFASEEYNEYVCAGVNDVFGFFLSGPEILGPFTSSAINMATIPGGSVPVSINTVNLGVAGVNGLQSNCLDIDPNFAQNNVYFVDNTTNMESTDIQYDGLTVELTAISEVIPDSTYHIKIALADGGDGVFDSGVFLKTSSLRSYYVGPVGIDETRQNAYLEAYPQPADESVSFGIEGSGWIIRIVDVTGKVQLEETLYSNTLSIQELKAGIYFAFLQNNRTGESGFSRLIIQ